MALGGGVFVGQNKTLPGAYVNFVSLAKSGSALSQRGTAAFALELDWGKEDEIVKITADEFVKNSAKFFGYDYTHEKLKGVREIFKNAKTLCVYRLGGSEIGADYAACDLASAKFAGTRGNDLKITVSGGNGTYTVKTLLDGITVDSQIVPDMEALKDNDYVVWDKDSTLSPIASMALEGGENPDVSTISYQRFLEKIEQFPVNAVGVCSEDPQVNTLFAAYAKSIRDDIGVKLQCVVYNHPADHEGIVNVKNSPELVYWVTGLVAGCEVNKSCLNKVYDGEFTIDADFTQSQLEDSIKAGEFTLHKVGDSLRVLADVNSLVTVTDEKGEAFKDNQTVRVVDQIASDIAALFNTKYLGNVANDDAGRVSLWADIVKHHEELARIRAIEGFKDDDVEVLAGSDKRSVVVNDKINVVNAMAQVYMTCVIA